MIPIMMPPRMPNDFYKDLFKDIEPFRSNGDSRKTIHKKMIIALLVLIISYLFALYMYLKLQENLKSTTPKTMLELIMEDFNSILFKEKPKVSKKFIGYCSECGKPVYK